MEIDIVQASIQDIEKLNFLVNSAYRGESSKDGWTTEADLLHGQRTDEMLLRQMIEQDDSVILLAYESDQDADDDTIDDLEDRDLLGCVYLQKKSDSCYLGMLTVQPKLQGNGIGARILAEAEIYAEFWDCQFIEMTVIKQRSELIAWYERHGFRQTGLTSPFPYGDEKFGIPQRDDLEFLILKKKLKF